MFLSEHDLQFLLILLAFATVLGIGVMHTLARPLTDDLAALTEVAKRVGAGDLGARAELERMDEVGDLASAIDSMIEQIATSRAARDEAERERSITMASLSHDARTPLTSMRLATEALIDGVAPDPNRYLRTIASDIESVETLIADLFTIGKLEAGRLELAPGPIDAMATVHDVAECMIPIAAEKSVSVTVTGRKKYSTFSSRALDSRRRTSDPGRSCSFSYREMAVADSGAARDANSRMLKPAANRACFRRSPMDCMVTSSAYFTL